MASFQWTIPFAVLGEHPQGKLAERHQSIIFGLAPIQFNRKDIEIGKQFSAFSSSTINAYSTATPRGLRNKYKDFYNIITTLQNHVRSLPEL